MCAYIQKSMIIFDKRCQLNIDEWRLVSGVEPGSRSISGRPVDNRSGRRRSGSKCGPRRSRHAAPPETLSSWTREKREESQTEIVGGRNAGPEGEGGNFKSDSVFVAVLI